MERLEMVEGRTLVVHERRVVVEVLGWCRNEWQSILNRSLILSSQCHYCLVFQSRQRRQLKRLVFVDSACITCHIVVRAHVWGKRRSSSVSAVLEVGRGRGLEVESSRIESAGGPGSKIEVEEVVVSLRGAEGSRTESVVEVVDVVAQSWHPGAAVEVLVVVHIVCWKVCKCLKESRAYN
jgi:hypothetical protein